MLHASRAKAFTFSSEIESRNDDGKKANEWWWKKEGEREKKINISP